MEAAVIINIYQFHGTLASWAPCITAQMQAYMRRIPLTCCHRQRTGAEKLHLFVL
jgi:hypothetical protein